ncbi:PAS domain-containing protein [Halobaculum litoreum]|uniref:PAS domain-containing protein n=1 Tax=Halobaculum litoreum TaxID=3031998 RepID=UPI0024C3011E|nr:PAS domain-containing protein [Halobaculum sp. DT92]
MYGLPADAVERTPTAFLEAIAPEDRDRVRDGMARLSAGSPVDMEYRVNPSTDYGTWVWVRAVPVVEDGEVVRIAGFTRDITDRRRRERHLFVMDTLLRHNLRNDLNVVLGRAEQIAESATEFAEEAEIIEGKSRSLLDTADKQRAILDVLGSHHPHHHADPVSAVRGGVCVGRRPLPRGHAGRDGDGRRRGRRRHGAGRGGLGRRRTDRERGRPQPRPGAGRPGRRRRGRRRHHGERRGGGDPPIPTVEANVLRGVHEMDDVVHSTGLGLWLVYWTVDAAGGSVTVESPPDGGEPRPDPPPPLPAGDVAPVAPVRRRPGVSAAGRMHCEFHVRALRTARVWHTNSVR